MIDQLPTLYCETEMVVKKICYNKHQIETNTHRFSRILTTAHVQATNKTFRTKTVSDSTVHLFPSKARCSGADFPRDSVLPNHFTTRTSAIRFLFMSHSSPH